MASRAFEMAWKSALVLLLWAFLDYLFERRHLESELKMSRQELVDEYKETEGNPLIKSRIRRLQRQARRRRMLEDTKRAAVVITNPTSYAIALEYRPDMPAPVVVAKGRNLLAAQIREIARWDHIPIVENSPSRTCSIAPSRLGRVFRRNSILSSPKCWRPFTARKPAPKRREAEGRRQTVLRRAQPVTPMRSAADARDRRQQRRAHPLSEWIVPIAAVSLVFVMLVPLPAFVLDLLLATSIAASRAGTAERRSRSCVPRSSPFFRACCCCSLCSGSR